MNCILRSNEYGGRYVVCNTSNCILGAMRQGSFDLKGLPAFLSACPYLCKARDAHWVISPGLLHTLYWFFREHGGNPGWNTEMPRTYPCHEMVFRLARHGSFFGFSLNPTGRIAYFQSSTYIGPSADLTTRVLIRWGKFLSFLDIDVEAQGPQYVSEFAAFVKQAAYSFTGVRNEFKGMDGDGDEDDGHYELPRRWITVEEDVSDVYCDEPHRENGELGNSCMNGHDSTVFYDDQGVSLAALWQDYDEGYDEGYELRARAILWKALRIDHNTIHSVHLMDRIYAAYPEDRRELELWADRNGYERRQDVGNDDDDDDTFRGWRKTIIFPLHDVPRPGRLPYMDTMFHLVCYEEHDSPGVKYCLTNDIGIESIRSSRVRNHLNISKIISNFELRETNGHENLNIPMQSRCDNCGTYEGGNRRILFDVSNTEHISICAGCYSVYQTYTRSGRAAMTMPHYTEEVQVIATRLTKVGDYMVYARRVAGLFHLSLVDHEEIEHLNVRAECPFCGLLFSNSFYHGEDECPACYYNFYKDPEPDYIVSNSIVYINTLTRTNLHNAFRR